MDHFWTYAKGMLRYRGEVALSLVMVLISSTGLGMGLVGAKPVLDSILGNGKDLPQLANELNESLAGGRLGSWLSGVQIPQATIQSLPTGAFTALAWIMGALGLVTFIASVANFAHAYLTLSVVNRTVTALRHKLFHAVLRAPLSRIIAGGATDAVSRIINDTRQLGDGFNQLLSRAVLQGFKGIAGLGAAFWFDWKVTAAALVAVPPLFAIIRKLGKKIRRASGRALESQADLLTITTQSLQALKVVKVNTAERLEAGRFHRINKRVLHELNRVRTARALASPLTEMLSVFLLIVLVLVAAKFILANRIEPSNFILAIISLAVAGASLKPVTGMINDIQASAPAADRIAKLLSAEEEPGHGLKLPKLPRHRASLELERVTYSYPNGPRPALEEVSLRVPHGSRVAVVGLNGSGKTTLLGLIPRLYDPQKGRVLVDGRDIRDVSVRSLREQIGVVTQETVLFKDTIRNNIAFAGEGVNDERIIDAARRARAHEFIAAMPQGYDSIVAEQGQSLSGGQRQRIAIARAILRDPAILILDEATSMIDAESEQRIGEAIAEFSKGRTTITVAHRIKTVVASDTILVLDQGRVVDVGSHSDLLGRCGVYQRIVNTQLLGGEV